MIDKRIVIDLAISQVGYHEKASNANLDDPTVNPGSGNYTKYSRYLDSIAGFYNGKKQGYAWCDQFNDAMFVMAYGVDLAMKLLCQPWGSAGAGCEYSAGYFKSAGQFYNYPEPGDQIFFNYGGGINHTGIVVAVNDFNVITVEGNADDMVKQCSYSRNSSIIAGYGRPNWYLDGDYTEPDVPDEPAPTTCEVTITVPVIKYGDVSVWVMIMQALLINKGCSCGRYGADGEYGPDTQNALYQFQLTNGLEADGVCSEETWQKLLV